MEPHPASSAKGGSMEGDVADSPLLPSLVSSPPDAAGLMLLALADSSPRGAEQGDPGSDKRQRSTRRRLAKSRSAQCAKCPARFNRIRGDGSKVRRRYSKGMSVCQRCYDEEQTYGEADDCVDGMQAPATPVRRTSSAPLSPLTPHQQTILRDAVKSDGSGKQGRTAAPKQHAIALQVLDAMRQVAPDRSVDVLVKTAAKAVVMSPVKLRQVHRHFEKTEELTPPKKPRITCADPLHPLFMQGGPPLVVESLLHKKLKQAAERNTYQSVMTLRAEVFAATGDEIPKTTMYRWLKQLGYSFGEKKLSGLTASYSAALIRRYIFDYSEMLQLEASGEYVLVWMDESYIHTGYCSAYSWFHPQTAGNTSVVQNRVRGSEKGKRLIIMHAMTRDGMLEDTQAEPTDDLSEVHASAAIVSAQLSAEGGDPEDYHKTLNGDKFVAWLRNRLLPAFEKRYNTHDDTEQTQGASRNRTRKQKQKKKMILILDNASYHHPRGEDWYTPSDMKKPALGKFLRDVAGVSSIADPQSGRVFPKEKLTADARGDGGGPTVKLMRSVVSDYLKSHPCTNTTVVQQLMSDQRAQCADLSVEEAQLNEEKEAEKENQQGEEN